MDSTHDSGDSTDSVPLPIGEYEVFLNFRGPDTRGITNILYRFLARSKIRTFRDDDELRKGEGWSNLVKAISQSKISIPIFSPRYAESIWCLKELAEIIEHRKREKGHIILPIFYKVDPRDVRHQTGPYEVAFQQHKRNDFDEETIQCWKAALTEVGFLKGWVIKTKEEEVDVADVIYEVVWSHLSKNNNELETDELVAIDDLVEHVVDMLELVSQAVNLVDLHGMGGIGKITLATAEPYLKEKSAWRKIRTALKFTPFLMKRKHQIAAAAGNDHHHITLINCSFSIKESLWNYVDEYLSISDEQALSTIKVKGKKNPDEPIEAAAVRIQNKFRSWKGRREFLVVLQQIVKIQAHVRGHHVRKNLKIISLGSVKKAVILRWKRNSSGHRKVKPELVKHGIEMSSAAQRSWGTLLSLNFRFQEQHETKQMKDKKLEAMQFRSSTDLLKHDLRSCNSMVTQEFYISKYPSFQISSHNFVSLLFPNCNLQQLWKGEEQLLVNLKYMDLNHSNLSEIPNLSKAQKLESVNLEGCENLVGVTSLQYLTKLKHLNLKGCQSLKGLPSLIRLKLLNTLDLSHCSSLTRLPPSLGCLPNLCELNLRNCTKLDYLPRTVMHLMRSLETLNVSGCYSLWKPVSRDVEIHSNLIRESTEDTCIEPQLIKPVEFDVAVDSPSQGLSSELEHMRGKKAIEWELDEDISMATPLIDYLPSELRTRLLLHPAIDFSPYISSHSSCSSKENKNMGVVHEEDQRQLFNGDHGDETGTVSVCCQVEDCGVDLSRAETYHQHHKICEVHCEASKALVGDLLQRFCLQCCRFHVLEDFEDEERNCRSRVAGYHKKQRRQSIAAEEEQHPTLLHKRRRTRTSDDAREQDWDEEGNAFGSIENDIVEMVERLSSWNGDGKEVPESVVAWLAELEQSVPETVISMKSAKAEAGAAGEKLKEMDTKLIVGKVELSLLDKELSRILEEEEEIEAQLQRLMDSKNGMVVQH